MYNNTSQKWKNILAEPDHQKQIMATINGVEYDESRIINASVSGRLFNAPSVGGAVSRTLTLTVMPHDAPHGSIPPMSEIRLFVCLVSADGQKSEYIPKGMFYSDEAKRDTDTGAVTITAFDAMLKAEQPMGIALCRVTFYDGFDGYQHFKREIGAAMPTPDTPSRTGERFVEWYPNPSDTETVVRDMLFTAQWEQTYMFTITFDSGDGTPQTFSVPEGDPTPTPETPTKDGHLFIGWQPTPAATVTEDAIYTALWAELVRVEIATYPAETDYTVGDALDYTGLSVVATYDNGATRDVTADCVMIPAEGTAIAESGNITVDVTYGGQSLGTFNVTVENVGGDWWTLYTDGLLMITLEGETPSYSPGWGRYPPWYAHNSKITSAFLSDGVTNIGASLFYSCDMMKSVRIPDGVTTIGGSAFYHCADLQSVELPDSVTTIDGSAFEGCRSLRSITIPDGVSIIQSRTFYAAGRISTIILPTSVTEIRSKAFAWVNEGASTKHIYYAGTEEQWGEVFVASDAFTPSSLIIHYNSAGPT